MIKRFFTCLMISISLICPTLQAQSSIFVKTDGNNSNDGLTWETAKLLDGALAAATSGTTIYLKTGVYNLTTQLTIPAGVRVAGGFAAASTGTDTTQRLYPGTQETWESTPNFTSILDASGYGRVATVQGTLEDCIVRNGYVIGNGGGVYIDGGTVSHCVIIRNRANKDSDTPNVGKGGGAYITNNGRLINCVVSYNFAVDGLAIAGNAGELVNNTITQNSFPIDCGLLEDVDGNVYTTVVIGTQCWMRENLRCKHYNDSTAISINYYAVDITIYGLIGITYKIAVARDTRICPRGWHVPTSNEVRTLIDYVASTYQYRYNGVENAIAKALASQEEWDSYSLIGRPGNSPNTNNATNFNAMPSTHNGREFRMWTSTSTSTTNNDHIYLCYYSNDATFPIGSNTYQIIRCLKD